MFKLYSSYIDTLPNSFVPKMQAYDGKTTKLLYVFSVICHRVLSDFCDTLYIIRVVHVAHRVENWQAHYVLVGIAWKEVAWEISN